MGRRHGGVSHGMAPTLRDLRRLPFLGPRPALRTNHRRRPCWHSTAAPGAEPVLQLAPRGTALRKIRRM